MMKNVLKQLLINAKEKLWPIRLLKDQPKWPVCQLVVVVVQLHLLPLLVEMHQLLQKRRKRRRKYQNLSPDLMTIWASDCSINSRCYEECEMLWLGKRNKIP